MSHSSFAAARSLFIGTVAVAVLVMTGCAAPQPIVVDVDSDEPSSSSDDARGGTGGPWIIRAEECLDVDVVAERSDWDLIDKNSSTSTVSTGCAYSNAEDTYAIGYYRISLSGETDSDSVDKPELGEGARFFEQSALGGDDTGCIVIVPLAGEDGTFLGITSNGGDEQPWREKCADAVVYLDLIAEQQPKEEEIPETQGDTFATDWVDCGPEGGEPESAYRTAEGAFTFCSGYTGYFTDREYGSLSLSDIGGAGGNACGTASDGREVCTDMESLVYFYWDDEEVQREILESWRP